MTQNGSSLCRELHSIHKIRVLPLRRREVAQQIVAGMSSDSSTADVTNRWSVIPPAALVEMSVGAIYCYSMFQLPLSTLTGVVCPAPDDFTTSQIIPVFSMAAAGLGLSSAALGTWVDKVGPVKAGTVGR